MSDDARTCSHCGAEMAPCPLADLPVHWVDVTTASAWRCACGMFRVESPGAVGVCHDTFPVAPVTNGDDWSGGDL